MPQTSVSSQDVYNHLRKFSDNWSQMESALNSFMASRIVLEYTRKNNHVEVNVDGARGLIRVPLSAAPETPDASQEPASAPEEPVLAPGDLEQAPEPEAAAPKKRGRPSKKVAAPPAPAHDPIKLTIHGVEVNYRAHVRELVSKIVTSFDMAVGEKIADDFIKEISEAA